MDLQLVGVGMPRTGTLSLKAALETLLDGPCYHMAEAFAHPEHVDGWRAALDGDTSVLPDILDGYVACVDFPCAAFWRELHALAPDAPALLSTRDSSEVWWRSIAGTIVAAGNAERPADAGPPPAMIASGVEPAMVARFITPDPDDGATPMARYERHNRDVRAGITDGRLVEWQPGDGWGPIAAALGLPVPDLPFPHANSTAEFRAEAGLPGSESGS